MTTFAVGSDPAAAAPGPTPAKAVRPGKLPAKHLSTKGKSRRSPSGEPGATTTVPHLPSHGTIGALIQLDLPSTFSAYDGAVATGKGKAAAVRAAKAQYGRIKTAQARLAVRIGGVAPGSRELYRLHSLSAGIAVRTDVRNFPALQRLGGVRAVYPILPKRVSNSYAVPLVGAPQAWTSFGALGADSTIAVIDTGIDYTHANFGGPGTSSAYQTALAADAADPDSNLFPNAKIIGGADFVGDAYDADNSGTSVPHPDANPLDCNGHGSHVAGTAAGAGVAADGSTYDGPYDTSTPFASMKIGPGVAPAALLYAYKVFGCAGSSNVVSAAIERATDPNDDGDPSDHADVINMSLGADFGSPQDGDAIESNLAVDNGITVVVASGNGGDIYDVGGSPGDATKVLTVANSVDAQNVVDALTVSLPGEIADDYGAERSASYTNWAGLGGDLSGDLVKPTDSNNLDGCNAFDSGDAAAISGNVAFLEWTDVGVRNCGSKVRADNVVAAGGVGFVLADDAETFSAGIAGNTAIPGVLVIKSAGDTIRAAMTSATVHVTGTAANGFRQQIPADDDKVSDSSSRGVRLAGEVKPDVTAVGTSVFSTAVGTGTEGISETGTSMATPMVAGTAALIHTMHPDWTPQEIKADIMNTAGQDLFTGDSHGGDVYAPNRVGAGRIQVDNALANQVVAYVVDDPGAVSVSFGPVAVTGPTTLTKTVKVVNKSNAAVSYDIGYEPVTAIPGVSYTVSPGSLTVDRRSAKTFTVTLSIPDRTALTKTLDPTVARTIDTASSGTLPRNFLADASGRVLLTPPCGGSNACVTRSQAVLRVPVYAAPRPASTMTQPAAVNLPGTGVQAVDLPLSGQGVDQQGTGDDQVQSIVSAAELQATSGPAPVCAGHQSFGCIRLPEERSADLKYVGTTSDTQTYQDPMDGLEYFAITTHGPWQTEVDKQLFAVFIDSTGDGDPDAVLYTTRLEGQDVFITELDDIRPGTPPDAAPLDIEAVNVELGDVDTAEFDSDTLLMPVAVAALPGVAPGSSRIRYGVLTESAFSSGPIDMVGVTADGTLHNPLSADVLRPGVTVAQEGTVLFGDLPDTTLQLTRDAPAYKADHGMGALLIHLHNAVGHKAQVVALKSPPQVTVALSASTVRAGTTVNLTATVANTVGAADGAVNLRRAPGASLTNQQLDATGKVVIPLRLPRGTYTLYVFYPGDVNYRSGYSNLVVLRVT